MIRISFTSYCLAVFGTRRSRNLWGGSATKFETALRDFEAVLAAYKKGSTLDALKIALD